MGVARADDLTGQPHDDPKDLLPAPAQASNCPESDTSGFLPLPSWARDAVMPPLPAVLKPNGKLAVLTTPPKAAPLTPPPAKDEVTANVIVEKPTPAPAAPAPAAPAPQPTALIAVSPFLDWIKANPHEAAQQARQEAGSYAAGSDASPAAPISPVSPSSGNAQAGTGPVVGAVVAPAGPGGPAVTPYWMPPLVDTAPFGSSGGNMVGSSAAIYTTPQR
jgi:hypothetical protein